MNFLVQSPHGWRDLWQRPHHVMSRFAAKGHRVRWVEPRYLAWFFVENSRFMRSRSEAPRQGVEVRSVTLINGERWDPIRNHNKEKLRRAISAPIGAGNESAPTVLWLYNPHESHLAASVSADLVIYDMMDEYRGFPWSPRQIGPEEDALIRRADWIFAGTQALYDSRLDSAEGKIECILSGVDVAHFARARTTGGRMEATMAYPDIELITSRYERVIGYAGMIDLRIDQELIALAARKHPEWGWMLIGEPRTDVTLLREIFNIHMLGPMPYASLPSYYASWDAAVVPFRENRLTLHTNPTKILEYAAAGIPIVAPALPEIRNFYADGAFLYSSDEEFIGELETILSGEEPPAERPEVKAKLAHAMRWTERRSWDSIAERMLARVHDLLESRSGNSEGGNTRTSTIKRP